MTNRLLDLVAQCVAIPKIVAQQIEKLIGVWSMKVTPRDASRTRLVLVTFSGDGSFTHIGAQKLPPFRRFKRWAKILRVCKTG
jgi:hypothetical protein